MSVHTTGGGGSGSLPTTPNRILLLDSLGAPAVSASAQWNGTEFAFGGAPSAGYMLKVLAAANSSSARFEAAATGTNSGQVVVGSSLLASFIQLVSNGSGVAGTDSGRANASLQKISTFNGSGLLVGPSDSNTWVRARANAAAAVGGVLKCFQADAAHDGAGTDVFYTYSIPAAAMSADGDAVEFDYVLTFAANANNKTVIVAYGVTELYNSGAVAKNGGSIRIFGRVVRTGAATQRGVVTIVDDAATARFPIVSAYTTPAETLSGAVALELRGTATAASDIVAKVGVVKFFPNGN